MTRRFPPSRLPVVGAHRAGFTLIELLTVIAIILVLAGLLLNVAGNANYKSSVARATAEVRAMETALEGYKSDNGTYPRMPATGTSTSDVLNAQKDTDPGSSASKSNYQGSSETLYQALSGITAFSGANATYGGKRYMEFKPGQLQDSSGSAFTTPAATTMIVDPFGQPYGYSTLQLADQANGTTPAATDGYNPTFDLWSTAGYGTGAKSYPTGVASTAYNTLWAKNW